jgi:hypothetical protein
MKFPQLKQICFCFVFLLAVILHSPRQAFSENENLYAQGTSSSLNSPAQKPSKPTHSSKLARKTSQRRHRKSKKGISTKGQSTDGSQEEVTDQREVSQQSDQTIRKKK